MSWVIKKIADPWIRTRIHLKMMRILTSAPIPQQDCCYFTFCEGPKNGMTAAVEVVFNPVRLEGLKNKTDLVFLLVPLPGIFYGT